MKKIKLIITSTLLLIAPIIALAQETKEATKEIAKSSYQLDVNTALTIVALLLVFPIFAAAKLFLSCATQYGKSTKPKSTKSATSIITLLLLLSSQAIFAQSKVEKSYLDSSTFTYFILFVVLIEIILIVFLSVSANNFIKLLSHETVKEAEYKMPNLWQRFSKYWKKANNFIPIEKESDIDTGHSYDGIRELDNITPPWFTAAFVASIIFAIVYLYRGHVSHTAPTQLQEFETEMAIAQEEKNAFLANQSENIDESNVTLLEGADISVGKDIFIHKCVACHADNGASKPGGVGPNLTDNFWIHGGSIKNIFATIKNGWPEKGMIAWKDQLTPKQIAQVSSFIKSINGTVPSGGKEPQGEPYTEAAGNSNNTSQADSSNNNLGKVDTAKAN